MAHETIKVSAPGNLLLLGEHAVLRNRHSVVCAINRRIHVRLTPRDDNELHIRSQLGNYSGKLDHLQAESPLQFVQAAIVHLRHGIGSGFDLEVESEFSDTIGFGSSAAVTVATVGAITSWRAGHCDLYDVFHASRHVIRTVQGGKGSGADVAASVFGGVLSYRQEPLHVEPLGTTFPISVYYSGSKTPTVEVIEHVERLNKKYPEAVRDLMQVIGDLAEASVARIKAGDLKSVGELMNMNHGLMDALGLCNQRLADLVYQLREEPGILGAKISGAGLGDCVIGIGSNQARLFDYDRISVEISEKGVQVD